MPLNSPSSLYVAHSSKGDIITKATVHSDHHVTLTFDLKSRPRVTSAMCNLHINFFALSIFLYSS